MYSSTDIPISHARLRIMQAGPSTGEPILFVHGWLVGGALFTPLFPYFAALGYRCISFDLPGFGASRSSISRYNYDTFANALHEVFMHLSLEKVILVGFSMGSAVVVRYLSQYGDARIKKMILIAPTVPQFTDIAGFQYGVNASASKALMRQYKINPSTASHLFLNHFVAKQLPSSAAFSFRKWLEQLAAQTQPEAGYQSLWELHHTDLRTEVAQLKCPLLILHGEQDNISPKKLAGYLHHCVTHSTFEMFAEAGHALFLEQPQRFINSVHTFISGRNLPCLVFPNNVDDNLLLHEKEQQEQSLLQSV
jgi:non-heme chloroperoxidase